MNKLADEYRKTLEAEAESQGVVPISRITLAPAYQEDIDELRATIATMAENQLKTLRHVADLTARLETLEKRAKSRIIGLN